MPTGSWKWRSASRSSFPAETAWSPPRKRNHGTVIFTRSPSAPCPVSSMTIRRNRGRLPVPVPSGGGTTSAQPRQKRANQKKALAADLSSFMTVSPT